MRKPLVLIPQFFGSLVFDHRTSRYLPFDRAATDLLLRLRSEPIEAIAREDRSLFAFYEHFASRGFFTLEGRFDGEVLQADPPPDHLLGPLAVHLEIIAQCNLACIHCFAGVLPRQAEALSLSEIDDLCGTLASLGSFRLGLTGGEPLMRKDLLEIIDAACGRGLHPCLTTNGHLIDERMARELGRRDLLWLNVSLDGATEETNDRIRGSGSFARTLERIRILRRHSRFTIAFTVTRYSAPEVRACAALAEELGAHTAVFRPLYPVGVAEERPDLMPTYQSYARALEELASLPHTEMREIEPFSPAARAEAQAKVHTNGGCGAGNLVASIAVDGTVSPCSFLGAEVEAGNIREKSFRTIWDEAFRAIRELPSGCGNFEGGCRARAKAFGGSLNAEDPWQRDHLRTGAVDPMHNLELSR